MPRARTAPPMQLWRRMLPGLALVAGLALFLLAVIEVGKYTRAQLSDSDRYLLDFSEIECPPPPAEKRADFLAEVQSQSGLPPRLHLLDEGLTRTLFEAFARHPYVEKVESVTVLPSREITVWLAYRIPVLEVMLSGEQSRGPARPGAREPAREVPPDDPSWFVDGKGVLLPRKKLDEPLPLMLVRTPAAGRAGEPWGVASVESAAETAAFLRMHQPKLHLKVFETRNGELTLSTPGGTRVLWGHAPGVEPSGEAKAEVKLDRLLGFCVRHGGLEKPGQRFEHDVRPIKNAIHRSLEE